MITTFYNPYFIDQTAPAFQIRIFDAPDPLKNLINWKIFRLNIKNILFLLRSYKE